MEEKQCFYGKLKGEWDMYSAGDLVMYLANFNGHIGRHIDGFYGVHEGYGIGQWNLKGRMLLVLSGKRIV